MHYITAQKNKRIILAGPYKSPEDAQVDIDIAKQQGSIYFDFFIENAQVEYIKGFRGAGIFTKQNLEMAMEFQNTQPAWFSKVCESVKKLAKDA